MCIRDSFGELYYYHAYLQRDYFDQQMKKAIKPSRDNINKIHSAFRVQMNPGKGMRFVALKHEMTPWGLYYEQYARILPDDMFNRMILGDRLISISNDTLSIGE
eukprot:TRINITY_DN467_c0_g1_i6.p1 TRINITY_DN467_c0_g1~~TRINITY_DN467_c0_g1_i6.p1  ORF type:complete len:104 (-),score=22.52 TRINITY_DN467_c0_g1_i6:86-397(-)